MSPALTVSALHKTFRIGFFRRRVTAVRGIDFAVEPGEIFGLLGPNGAGKTTTIKTILRLVFPTAGSVRLFGSAVGPEVLRNVGYMPENPYVYRYLKPLEFLDLCGRLAGLGPRERRSRSRALLGQVGLQHATERPIGKFSKGMMQRIGLAQALLHEPSFLILDEPMSGLDPVGRREVRELLVEQREQGRTLLFTSHILTDVETLCDRVAIMSEGRIAEQGSIQSLLHESSARVDIELVGLTPSTRSSLAPLGRITGSGERTVVVAEDRRASQSILTAALQAGAQVVSVTPHRLGLEELFVRVKNEATSSNV